MTSSSRPIIGNCLQFFVGEFIEKYEKEAPQKANRASEWKRKPLAKLPNKLNCNCNDGLVNYEICIGARSTRKAALAICPNQSTGSERILNCCYYRKEKSREKHFQRSNEMLLTPREEAKETAAPENCRVSFVSIVKRFVLLGAWKKFLHALKRFLSIHFQKTSLHCFIPFAPLLAAFPPLFCFSLLQSYCTSCLNTFSVS